MKRLIIPCMVLILSASCTNQLADDVICETEQTTQYINVEDGIKAGTYLISLSYYCPDLAIPADVQKALDKNPNDINAIISAMQCLEIQYVFGDTLAECEEYYLDWVTFCELNHIKRNYTII